MSSSLIDDSNQDLPATKSYNKFLVEVTEKLSQTEEYYLVKYEFQHIIRQYNNIYLIYSKNRIKKYVDQWS